MSRTQTAEKIIQYLEDRINCENIIEYTREFTANAEGKSTKPSGSSSSSSSDSSIEPLTLPSGQTFQLKIDNVPTSLQQLVHDTSDETERTKITKLDAVYSFVTESNYTGFEYFPYIYGVIDCHEKSSTKSVLYTYTEQFDGDFLELANALGHASDWYDIVFQYVVISHYLINISHYEIYNELFDPSKFLYKKHTKPFYKTYEFQLTNPDATFTDGSFSVNHKYLLVTWNFDELVAIEGPTSPNFSNCMDLLLQWFDTYKSTIPIYPSSRILQLLTELKDTANLPTPMDIWGVLNKYYQAR